MNAKQTITANGTFDLCSTNPKRFDKMAQGQKRCRTLVSMATVFALTTKGPFQSIKILINVLS